MIGKVGEAVSDVAEKIRSFLHFSVPDEGPLTDYESWMPDFVGGLAKGIERSRGMISGAVSNLAGDLGRTPYLISARIDQPKGKDISTGSSNGKENQIIGTGSGNGGYGDIVIPVYLGGSMIDEIVVTAQQRMNLKSGGR